MLIILMCMLCGIITGYLFRRFRLRFIHRTILTLIWLLLFLLGLELGSNKTILDNFGRLGLDALILTIGGTLGSILASWALWTSIQRKNTGKTT